MAMLDFVKGINQGNRLELTSDRVVFGRDAKCQVVLNLPAVSREHAQIRKIGPGYFIEDMGSRNGTEVNNVRITARTPLKDGQQITICGNSMVFYDVAPKPKLPDHMRTVLMEPEEEDNATVEATILESNSKQIFDASSADRLKILLEVGIELTQATRMDGLMPKLVDNLFRVFTQADRAFIILKEEDKLIPKVVRTRRAADEDDARFSRRIVNRCIDTAQAILSEDASADKQFDMSQSITDCRIRSVVVAPLMSRSEAKAVGVIQLDMQDRFKKFTQDDLRLLMAVAAQAGLALENARIHEASVARAELDRDLELAQRVQKSFLPKKFPQAAGYEFFAHYEAAQEVGGDYYDFVNLPNKGIAILIGDVAGKGVPAALLMSKVSSDARFCALTEPDLATAIGKLNEQTQEAGKLDRFVTFGACLVDINQHTVTVVNAGHLPPIIYRGDTKKFEDGCTKEQSGFPLGILSDIQYEANTITLAPGDSVLLYTDGAPESRSKDDKSFGMNALYEALKAGPMTPMEIGVRLVNTIKRHAMGRKPHDDLTVVTFGRVK